MNFTGASQRSLECHHNLKMVAAAFIVSLLGAFTLTQLVSQARISRSWSGKVIWTALGCRAFGFCGIWCLHFLGMLSCRFDVPIGLEPLWTVLSAILSVVINRDSIVLGSKHSTNSAKIFGSRRSTSAIGLFRIYF